MVRATRFGKDFNSYYQGQNENILGIVQVETPEILHHLDEIAAIDNIDVLFIGPLDLSMALGVFGQFDHPLFSEAVGATVSAARKAGKAAGILLFNPDELTKYYEIGMTFLACGSDSVFVANGAAEMADRLNRMRFAKK
jgi:4-hydroxy-2-oxoheptanedioate aldolase